MGEGQVGHGRDGSVQADHGCGWWAGGPNGWPRRRRWSVDAEAAFVQGAPRCPAVVPLCAAGSQYGVGCGVAPSGAAAQAAGGGRGVGWSCRGTDAVHVKPGTAALL